MEKKITLKVYSKKVTDITHLASAKSELLESVAAVGRDFLDNNVPGCGAVLLLSPKGKVLIIPIMAETDEEMQTLITIFRVIIREERILAACAVLRSISSAQQDPELDMARKTGLAYMYADPQRRWVRFDEIEIVDPASGLAKVIKEGQKQECFDYQDTFFGDVFNSPVVQTYQAGALH